MVEQILLNLLKNSIEALARGTRHHRDRRRRPPGIHRRARRGPGLDADAESNLFRPFSTTKGPAGTGLGLAVSRRLARLLGGDLVHVPSERGARWRLHCPAEETTHGTRSPRPARLLLVDDDEAACRLLAEVLEREAYEVVSALSAEEALKAGEAGPFDAVLTDLRMPGSSGLDLLRPVRERDPSALVLVLTAFGDAAAAGEAIRAGAYDFISKPYDIAACGRRSAGRWAGGVSASTRRTRGTIPHGRGGEAVRRPRWWATVRPSSR